MKKIFICLMMAIACATTSAEVKTERSGNTFTEIKAEGGNSRSKCIATTYTYKWNGKDYPIYINKETGRCHIKYINSKGNKASKYLSEDVEKTICKDMGITWVPKKKKN